MKNTLLLTLSLLAAALAARAQDVYMDMFNSANQAAVSMSLVNISNAAMLASARNASAKRGSSSAASPASRINFSYVPSVALRQQTVREISSKLQASSPAAAQSLANAFGPGKTDYNQLFTAMVKESGLPADNAATAFAAYLELGYVIVHNVQDQRTITPAMDRGLQQQVAGLLAQNKGLTSPTAVAKFGEATKLQAILLYLGWQSAQKSGQASQFRSSIAGQFRQQGLDLNLLQLTAQGLVKK